MKKNDETNIDDYIDGTGDTGKTDDTGKTVDEEADQLNKYADDYENTDDGFQFYQNQINFAVWCATSGCGVSYTDHLQHKNKFIRSLYRYHFYYQVQRIMKQLEVPLPGDDSFNQYDNQYNKGEKDRLFTEFGLERSDTSKFKLGLGSGIVSLYGVEKQYIPEWHHMTYSRK